MDGDRRRLPANRNCYIGFRVSRELCSNFLFLALLFFFLKVRLKVVTLALFSTFLVTSMMHSAVVLDSFQSLMFPLSN